MTKESTMVKLLKKEGKKRNHRNNKQCSLDTVEIKEKYGDLIENTDIAIATIDKKGRLIYVNNGICSLSGYTKNELLGRLFVDFLHPDDKKKMIKLFLFALFKSKEKIHFEFRFIHKNSTIITCCTSPTIFRSEGKIKGFHAIIQDITGYKKTEEQLKISGERYRNLIELAPDSIVTMDLKGYITSCNSAATRIFRYSKDELVGKHFSKIGILHVKDIPKYLKVFVSVLRGKGIGIYELTVNDKDGISRIVETHIGLIKENNKISGVIAITRDITERKRMEENLKNSLERLTLAQKAAKTGFWDWDMKTEKLTWSKELFELFGLPSDTHPTFDTWRKVLHPNDRKRAEEKIYRSIEDKISLDNEYRIILSDGKERWIRVQGDTFYDNFGNPQRICGICIDVTRQKQMEDGLKQIERELNKAQQIAHVGSWVWDTKNQTLTWTDELYRIYGVDKVFTLTFDNIVSMIHPEDREKNAAKVKELLESATTLEYEFRIIRPDTSIRHIFQSVEVSRDSTGKPLRTVGIMQDITERKNAEETLRESQKRFQALTETTNDFVWEMDAHGVYTYCSPQMNELWGYKPEDMIGRTPFDVMIPEDRAHYIKMFRSMSKSPKSFQGLESNSWDKNGRIVKLETSGVPFFDIDGRLHGYRGISRDITERKRAEENLRKNEEKFRILFDSSPELIIENDDDGKILALNQMMAKSLGAPSEKLIGKNIFDILPKEIAEERAKIARMALKGGKNLETDDERAGRYFHNIYVPVLHPDGTKTIQTIVRDITERKKIEDALLEGEEKYRVLFNDVPVGISITDKSGHIMDCNQYMAKIFRYTLEELKAINIKSLYINLKDRERLLNLLNKEGRVVDWECLFKRKDGNVFSAILNTDVIERDGQKLNLTTLRDITERKVAEEKIRKQNVQLKKLDGVKTDFLNTTSHELRTPVASIKGYIQMLLKHTLGDITEEQKKALEVVLRNTNRLDALIQDILDISRLESGTMKFIPEKTDVMKMVNEVAETMQTSADVKKIKINSDIQKDLPDLMIDSERVKQVLINLVDNAIKFSPDGSMILIKARKEKENIVFEVQDFGRGIPKNKQKRIFERFYQVDSGIDRKFGGIGLGLTISRKIIDTYGGHIWVDSIVGKGSSFKFSLPLQSTKDIEDYLQEIPMELP